MRKAFKIAGLIVGCSFLAVVVFIGSIGYLLSSGSIEFEPLQFSSSAWKAAKPEMTWESLRLKMVDDLMENHLSRNQSKESVIALIGKPDDTEYFRDYDMVYYLGRERNALGMDSEWLVFKVNNDIVKSYHLVRD